MKILFSCLSKSWGGMEMLTLTQMQRLLDRNISVELLCLSKSRMNNEGLKRGYNVRTLNSPGSINPAGILRLTSILRKNKFDLIHSHASGDLWTIVPALKIIGSGIPLFLTKHVGSRIIKKDLLHRKLYSRVTTAFAISEVIRKNLIDTTPLSEKSIMLVHNGIDVEKFDPAKVKRERVRSELKIDKNEIAIGMMGRFSPGKGHEEFLRAAKMLNEKNDNLKFIVVGEASFSEESYFEKIKNLSRNHGLTNVVFTGYVNETKNILSAFDIFVFPSHAESFGLALAEAMAMECPSVSSNSDGVLDISVDNETGLLFENKNAADLADKISTLIHSDSLRQKFGKAARQRVVEKFNLDIQTDKMIDIYNSQIPG